MSSRVVADERGTAGRWGSGILRVQFAALVTINEACGDLKPGERLPDSAVAEESRESSNPAPAVRSDRGGSRLPWWVSLGWIAAAGLIGIVAVLWIQNSRLRQNAVQLTKFAEQQRITADQSHRLDEIFYARDAQRIELLPINHKIATPAGKAIYSRERGGLIFVASNLNPLPPQKAYELWLIPTEGAPIPAGVFKPDARGGAVVLGQGADQSQALTTALQGGTTVFKFTV